MVNGLKFTNDRYGIGIGITRSQLDLNSLNHQEITIETGTEYSKGWGQWFQVFRIKHLGQTIIDSTGTRVEERVERGWA